MMFNKRNKKRGFTLIELIIVIAIIAILAAIAVPAFGKIREKANVSSDVANARTIYSLVATEIANDKIQLPTGEGEVTYWLGKVGTNNTNIRTMIDPAPQVKAYQDHVFVVTLDKDGTIQIDIAAKEAEDTATPPIVSQKVYPTTTNKYSSN